MGLLLWSPYSMLIYLREEVVECIDDGIADDEACDAIQEVISDLFDRGG